MSARAVDDNVWPGLLPAIATKVGGRLSLTLALACALAFGPDAVAQQPAVLGDLVDVSQDFQRMPGLFALPGGEVERLNLRGSGGAYALQADPLRGRVNWRVTRFPPR